MKIPHFFLLVLVALFYSCHDSSSEKVAQVITDVKSEFVPDRRVAIFDVEVVQNKELTLRGETNLVAAKETLLQKLEKQQLKYIDSIQILPAADLDEKNYGVVRLSVCNIRSQPKHSAELSTQATLGTPLRIYKKQGDWYYVQTPDNYLGWLDKDGFTAFDKTTFDAWMQSSKVIITAPFTRAYLAADVSSEVVSDLLVGNILLQKGRQGDFEKVEFPDGRMAFIPVRFRQYLDSWLEDIQADTLGVFQSAKRLMGSPYLWGGTSSKGMDCSGYTKTIFFENGLLLPRDASQQVHIGQEVETDTTLKNLIPGDLLFFGRKATPEKKERIWHVALYLGEGKMIHSAGNVKIESLRREDENFAEDRLLTLVRAKRILGQEGKNNVKRLRDSKFYR